MPPLWLTFVIFIPLASLELRLRATIRTSLRFPVNSVCDSATYSAIRGRETKQAVRWCCCPSLPSTALGPGTWDGGQEGQCSKESHLQPQRQGPTRTATLPPQNNRHLPQCNRLQEAWQSLEGARGCAPATLQAGAERTWQEVQWARLAAPGAEGHSAPFSRSHVSHLIESEIFNNV